MKLIPLSIVGLFGATLLLPLTGCVQSSPATPPGSGAAATFTEADKGKTAHIGLGETVVIRLAVNENTGNRWFLRNALAGGVVFKKGLTNYQQTPGGTVATLVYQGGKVGTQELHFYYAPPEERQNVARTADFRVIVH